MLLRLALLFVLVPLVELALLIQMGRWVGVLPTVALVVLTGILGAALARIQGFATLARFQTALAEGRLPHREMVEGILILVAGALLLTPGMLTDATGFVLLVPPIRRAVTARLLGWLERRLLRVEVGVGPRDRAYGETPTDAEVVDAEFEVVGSEERRRE